MNDVYIGKLGLQQPERIQKTESQKQRERLWKRVR